jgi:cytochrome P450
LIGHGLSPFKRPPGEDYLKWMKEIPNDGMIAFRGFAYSHSIILTNAKTISEVLVHKSYEFVKPPAIRHTLGRILGDGLVVVEGDAHKFQRKNILPVFGFRHIKELYPMMWKKAVALTQRVTVELREHPEPPEMDLAGVVEINQWASKVTLDIIGVAGLGRDFNTLKNSDDVLAKSYEELLTPSTDRVIHFALSNLLPRALVIRLPMKVNELLQRVTSTLHDVCNQLVREKRELVKTTANEQFDILSVLLKSNNFSDQELTDQLLTFLAAGYVLPVITHSTN